MSGVGSVCAFVKADQWRAGAKSCESLLCESLVIRASISWLRRRSCTFSYVSLECSSLRRVILCIKSINLLRGGRCSAEAAPVGWTIERDGAEDTLEEADGGGRAAPPGIKNLVI